MYSRRILADAYAGSWTLGDGLARHEGAAGRFCNDFSSLFMCNGYVPITVALKRTPCSNFASFNIIALCRLFTSSKEGWEPSRIRWFARGSELHPRPSRSSCSRSLMRSQGPCSFLEVDHKPFVILALYFKRLHNLHLHIRNTRPQKVRCIRCLCCSCLPP